MATKDTVYLEKKDNVYYLYLNNPKANAFSPAFIRKIHAQLEIVEKDPSICALVTVSTLEKIYSTGLDLKAFSTFKHRQDFNNFLLEFAQLLGRLLVFPVPTIALLQGITMAGGFMFAVAHDYRFMVSDKAWICLNEVDMGMPLIPGLSSVVQCKLQPHAYRELVLAGRKIEAKEAKELKIVDFVCERDEISKTVYEFANEVAEKSSDKDNFKALKMEAYLDAYTKATDRKFGIHTNVGSNIKALSKL